ncbi:ANTAR domain-containing protein [Caenimonas sedimenti]|uniref:ANTAR domain-containing protein n=1 Tax=Caenimonas sedimenti TaxID=2596921 RepID=A0A562ZDX5_9BURK|nr:ANTAR domain-containing protein [Caenimonas sedimenti]TWO63374.1 ANTAR domain-containing protein [Caenimonas sedimenti]
MISVLLVHNPDPDAPALAADFAAAGFTVLGPAACAHLVREALRQGPNVVVCWEPRPSAALFDALRSLQVQQPLPVLVFTQDSGVERMNEALTSGVHAWVVQGYARERLRPLVHLAQAREAHERQLRETLADLTHRFEERKLVDKAKGILMRARRVSEDEAFHLLRTASMHANQRVGQVSRQVIDAAQVAEAINRAGQQRMLSQRLVKLYALACARTEATAAALLMRQSAARIDDNLAVLGKLSAATFGDLLEAAQTGWAPLRDLVAAPAQAAVLARVDALAEAMLAQADALVVALETSGLAKTVSVINVSGRQRMLSQRMAKQALLGADGKETAAAFEDGMKALANSPLATQEIREGLASARTAWERLLAGAAKAHEAAGRKELAATSEELLELFDRLTDAYQHSIQVLMG